MLLLLMMVVVCVRPFVCPPACVIPKRRAIARCVLVDVYRPMAYLNYINNKGSNAYLMITCSRFLQCSV